MDANKNVLGKHIEASGELKGSKIVPLDSQHALLGPSYKGLASKMLTRGAIRAKSFISLQLYENSRGGASASVREDRKKARL